MSGLVCKGGAGLIQGCSQGVGPARLLPAPSLPPPTFCHHAHTTSPSPTCLRTGALSVAGILGNVSLSASGITETTISGTMDRVTLTLSGISNVYVISDTPRVFIAGT